MMSKLGITYLLSQKIGIYYKHREWAERVFDEAISTIPKEAISKIVKGRYDMFCELYDGSCIKCIAATDSARAHKFDKVLIEPEINKKIYEVLIMPTLVSKPKALVVSINEEDLLIPKEAKYYYMETDKNGIFE